MKKMFILFAFLGCAPLLCSNDDYQFTTPPLLASDLSSLGKFSVTDSPFLNQDQKDFIDKLKQMTQFESVQPRDKWITFYPHSLGNSVEYEGDSFFVINRTTTPENSSLLDDHLSCLERQSKVLRNKSDIRLVKSAIALIVVIDEQRSCGYSRSPFSFPTPYEVELMEKNVEIVTNSAWRKLIKVKDNISSYGTLKKFALALTHGEFRKYYALSQAWESEFSDRFNSTVEKLHLLEENIIQEAKRHFRKRKRGS